MDYVGHFRNGVVVLDGNPNLPEGAAVTVSYRAPDTLNGDRKRVEFPLIRTGQPGSVHLSNERIGEILDGEDLSSRR